MRTRPVPALAGCLLLVGSILGGCGQSEPAGGTTLPPPSATAAPPATSSAPTPSTTAAIITSTTSTTTTEPASEAAPQILVAGPDGVYLVGPGAEPVQLISGRAATAVDDGLGGLLYQVDAGRAWDQTGEPRTTIVWWVPAGSERPLDLLVPATGQSLTLEDAIVDGDDLSVFYRRSEGAPSFEMVDSLRRYDQATGTVTELIRHSAWEAALTIGSVGGGIIAGTSYGQLDASCLFLGFDGTTVHVPADPSVPGCEEPYCPHDCVISLDGSQVAHLETRFDDATNTTLADVVVVAVRDTGVEMVRIDIPHARAGTARLDGVASVDLAGSWILVNRTNGGEAAQAWLVPVDGSEVPAWEVPMAGVARFVTAPVTVRPAQLSLRGDGLGIVALGQPEASALPLLVARFGEPSDEWRYDPADCPPGDAGRCCFAQTGYGCESHYRGVGWEEAALSVIFADGHTYRDDGIPHLTYWSTGKATDRGLATEDGIAVGATVDELRAAYGDRLVRTSIGCGDDLPAYRLDGEMPMTFRLSGPHDDAATTITGIWAGNPGSC